MTFYACCIHCAHGFTPDMLPDRHTAPCPEGCNDDDANGDAE